MAVTTWASDHEGALLHLFGQAVTARLCFVDGLHEFFESDLARRMVESLGRQPQAMFARPMIAGGPSTGSG
jgi:hypothetical protein